MDCAGGNCGNRPGDGCYRRLCEFCRSPAALKQIAKLRYRAAVPDAGSRCIQGFHQFHSRNRTNCSAPRALKHVLPLTEYYTNLLSTLISKDDIFRKNKVQQMSTKLRCFPLHAAISCYFQVDKV